jgi:hypothetical protein
MGNSIAKRKVTLETSLPVVQFHLAPPFMRAMNKCSVYGYLDSYRNETTERLCIKSIG